MPDEREPFWEPLFWKVFGLPFWEPLFFGKFLGFHFGNPESESRAIKIKKQMVRMLLLEI